MDYYYYYYYDIMDYGYIYILCIYIYIYYGLLPYNVINHDISYIHHNYIMLYSLSPTRDPSKRPAAPTKKPSRCSAGRRPLLRRSRRCSGCGSCRSSWTNRSPQPKSATGTAWRWTVGFCHGKKWWSKAEKPSDAMFEHVCKIMI